MTTILTDAQIASSSWLAGRHQDLTQAARYVPVVVDLTVSGITIGRAILEAAVLDAALAQALMGTMTPPVLPLTREQEERILQNVHYIAFESPAVTVDLLAYPGATVHKLVVPAGEETYKPVADLFRMYATSASTTVLLGVGVD